MHEPGTEEIRRLSEGFLACSRLLTALGDETRQHLFLEMLKMGECNGVRVGKITEKTHLSRPAVSHHLKIMKEAGIIQMRREGTKNYYYFDLNRTAVTQLIETLQLALAISESLPDRNGQDG